MEVEKETEKIQNKYEELVSDMDCVEEKHLNRFREITREVTRLIEKVYSKLSDDIGKLFMEIDAKNDKCSDLHEGLENENKSNIDYDNFDKAADKYVGKRGKMLGFMLALILTMTGIMWKDMTGKINNLSKSVNQYIQENERFRGKVEEKLRNLESRYPVKYEIHARDNEEDY